MMNKKEIVEESICKIDKYGNKEWYNLKGELHRENDLPAIEWVNGTKRWYINDKLHRENDKPAVENVGGKYWYINDLVHRENDKPAIERADGSKDWYLNDKLHREKGPTRIYTNGIKEWWWHGEKIKVNSQEEFEEKLPYLIIKDLHED